MRIWIINPYGTLPDEAWSAYRSTFIAEVAAARGHEVTWFISDFEHRSKQFRTGEKRRRYGPGYEAVLVPSTAYRSHASLARIRYERNYARNLLRIVQAESKRPDVIIHGEPALMFADITGSLAARLGAKLVIDIIDLWPELFAIKFASVPSALMRALCTPAFAKRTRFLQQADAFTAVTPDYLELGTLAKPGVPAWVTYWGVDLKAVQCRNAPDLPRRVPEKGPGEFWCVYAGTLGINYDIPTIIKVAREARQRGFPLRFIIAGDGPLGESVAREAREDLKGIVHYLGRVPQTDLASVYAYSDLALCSYVGRSTVSMPVKAFDYLAAGLPIVNSLGREIGRLVRENKVGFQYEAQSAESLFNVLTSAATNPEEMARMRKRAEKLAMQFDTSVQYGIFVSQIEDLV